MICANPGDFDQIRRAREVITQSWAKNPGIPLGGMAGKSSGLESDSRSK